MLTNHTLILELPPVVARVLNVLAVQDIQLRC